MTAESMSANLGPIVLLSSDSETDQTTITVRRSTRRKRKADSQDLDGQEASKRPRYSPPDGAEVIEIASDPDCGNEQGSDRASRAQRRSQLRIIDQPVSDQAAFDKAEECYLAFGTERFSEEGLSEDQIRALHFVRETLKHVQESPETVEAKEFGRARMYFEAFGTDNIDERCLSEHQLRAVRFVQQLKAKEKETPLQARKRMLRVRKQKTFDPKYWPEAGPRKPGSAWLKSKSRTLDKRLDTDRHGPVSDKWSSSDEAATQAVESTHDPDLGRKKRVKKPHWDIRHGWDDPSKIDRVFKEQQALQKEAKELKTWMKWEEKLKKDAGAAQKEKDEYRKESRDKAIEKLEGIEGGQSQKAQRARAKLAKLKAEAPRESSTASSPGGQAKQTSNAAAPEMTGGEKADANAAATDEAEKPPAPRKEPQGEYDFLDDLFSSDDEGPAA